jgi:hypothetical protein
MPRQSNIIAAAHRGMRGTYVGDIEMVAQPTNDDPYTMSAYYDDSLAIVDVDSDRCADVVLADMTSSLRVFHGRNCQATLPHPSRSLRLQRR